MNVYMDSHASFVSERNIRNRMPFLYPPPIKRQPKLQSDHPKTLKHKINEKNAVQPLHKIGKWANTNALQMPVFLVWNNAHGSPSIFSPATGPSTRMHCSLFPSPHQAPFIAIFLLSYFPFHVTPFNCL